ncbi:MAG: CinA family protein [Campylobacteraceae bacterium]
MKIACLIIGNNLVNNRAFLNYIMQNISKKFEFPTTIKCMQKNDKELLFVLEDLAKTHEYLIVLTNDESFALTSKIVSTLTNDSLELKDGFLIPSKSIKYEKDSFLLSFNNSFLNVVKLSEGEKLPNFLYEKQKDSLHVNIFGVDILALKEAVEKYTKTLNIEISVSLICKNWALLHVKNSLLFDKQNFFTFLKDEFYKIIIVEDDVILYIIQKLKEKNESIAFAESCNGGILSAMFTTRSGVSSIFKGSVVSYSYESKEKILGVDKKIFEEFGSISKECIQAMTDGVFKEFNSTYAIATSGLAGPNGGSKEKPIGTVFVGIAKKGESPNITKLHINGDREYIQISSAQNAIASFIVSYL